MEDQFIQLQLEDASQEVNEALLPYDIVIRVDDQGKPSSFTLELNHEHRNDRTVIDYYDSSKVAPSSGKALTAQEVASFIEISPHDSAQRLAKCINQGKDLKHLIKTYELVDAPTFDMEAELIAMNKYYNGGLSHG